MKDFKEKDLEEIINYQFDLNGYKVRYKDIKLQEEWYLEYPTTLEKEEKFRQFLLKRLKPFVHKSILERDVRLFILDVGLTTAGKRSPEKKLLDTSKNKESGSHPEKEKESTETL